MPTTEPPQIRFAAAEAQLYLAVDRRATHQVSLVAESLVSDFLARGPQRPEIVLDLGQCGLIDSTFAGWMLKLRRQVAELDGRPVISGCTQACRSALEVMGLLSYFPFEPIAPPAQTQQITCTSADEDNPEAIELMMHAHEDLAETTPENKKTFTPIAEALRQELKKKKKKT